MFKYSLLLLLLMTLVGCSTLSNSESDQARELASVSDEDIIRLMRKTHGYAEPELVNKLSRGNLEQGLRKLLRRGPNFSPGWGSSSSIFLKGMLCLRSVVKRHKDCEATREEDEKLTFKALKQIISEQDLQKIGRGVHEITLGNSFSRQSFEKLARNEDRRKHFYRNMKRYLSMDVLGQEYMKHLLKVDNFLFEKIVLFWMNHFVTSSREVREPALIIQQNNLIRKFALGNFKAFVKAITYDPAMILYLNLDTNKCAKKDGQKDCSTVNENYARELLELFSLGADADSGSPNCYTENDIQTIAKALTGHRVNNITGQYVYRKGRSDYDRALKSYPRKQAFLERCEVPRIGSHLEVSTTNITNTNSLINVLFERRSSQIAKFIVEKAYKAFISPEVNWESPELIELTQNFAQTMNLKQMFMNLFLLDEMYKDTSLNSVVKSPIELIFGTLRTFKIKSFKNEKEMKRIRAFLKTTKQTIFGQPDVKGWRTGENWIDTASYTSRILALSYILSRNKTHICEEFGEGYQLKFFLEGQSVDKVSLPKTFRNCNQKIKVLRRIFRDPIYQVK